MIMEQSLIILRIIGGLFSSALVIWSLGRFRRGLSRRSEFVFFSFLGIGLLLLSVYPDSINIVAGMLSLDDKQFGRLITVLILSNMFLWVIVFGLRGHDGRRAIQFDFLVRGLASREFFREYGSGCRPELAEITVVIPALDEAENLDQILPRMPQEIEGRGLKTLVVDDGSRDDTVSVSKRHGCFVVSSVMNRGGGAALRLGYDVAIACGAKILVTMDGDGQHMPEEIAKLVGPVLRDEVDFVIGSRVLGEREKDNTVRWVGIHVFNFIINLLAGTKITDCSSGFRAFRCDQLKRVVLLRDQFHTAELIIDAARKGIRIGEAPVSIKKRLSGQSKKGTNLRYGLSFAKTIFKTWWR